MTRAALIEPDSRSKTAFMPSVKPLAPRKRKKKVKRTYPSAMSVRLLNVIPPGVEMTLREIASRAGVAESSHVANTLTDAVNAGDLERGGSARDTSRSVFFTYRKPAQASEPVVTNNPFLWRTYQPWRPS